MQRTQRCGVWGSALTALLLTFALTLAVPTAAHARNGGFHGGGHSWGGHGFHGGFGHPGFHGGSVRFGIGIGFGWPLWYGYPYYGYPYYAYPAYPSYPYYGYPYYAYPPAQYGSPAPVAPSAGGCYDAYGNWVSPPCQPYATQGQVGPPQAPPAIAPSPGP